MQINEILNQLDALLHACQLDKAEAFLLEQTAQARQCGDTDAEKTLLSELIGFYRDCGRFPEALETAAAALALFESAGDTESIPYATTLLNCANAYRAAGAYDPAFAAYETVEAIYQKLLPADDPLVASLWNNKALLYQETEAWEASCHCLEQALRLVRQAGNEIRIAISCTNLAVSLLRLHETERALSLLTEADEIFRGRTPSDFHYSATLAGFGDAYYQLHVPDKAATYYEMALPEIELHMGRNNFYHIVEENLMQAYAAMGTERPQYSGLELSRRFYEMFGAPVLERNFPTLLPQLAIGLSGEGSECLGFDDALSRDHDFGAGFCIWIPDQMPEESAAALQEAYDALPRSCFGIPRVDSPQAAGRVGVCRQKDFFQRLLGTDDIPKTEAQWLAAEEAMLTAAVSGAIFRDDSGIFTEKRRKLAAGYPKAVFLRRLAQALARMAQCGQYNYSRMRRRGDFAAAQLYLAEFCKSTMQAAHLCAGVYAPYEKWLLRSTEQLPSFDWLAAEIRTLLLTPPLTTTDFDEKTDAFCIRIQHICEKIAQEAGMKDTEEIYLDDAAQNLAAQAQQQEQHDAAVERIVQLEWETFDKVQNIGGRAACQDDWETFSIMRRSQYQPWPTQLLTQWIEVFEQALADGRNLITEKYAYMMESTDPEAFAEIKDKLPAVSEECVQLREAIIAIQIPWMEEFAASYPNLASRARTIHTEEDSQWETSYETYLRGELTVYPFELLYGYGRWIVSLHQQGKNLSRMILEETVHDYGYRTLEEAEENGCCP